MFSILSFKIASAREFTHHMMYVVLMVLKCVCVPRSLYNCYRGVATTIKCYRGLHDLKTSELY